MYFNSAASHAQIHVVLPWKIQGFRCFPSTTREGTNEKLFGRPIHMAAEWRNIMVSTNWLDGGHALNAASAQIQVDFWSLELSPKLCGSSIKPHALLKSRRAIAWTTRKNQFVGIGRRGKDQDYQKHTNLSAHALLTHIDANVKSILISCGLFD